MKKYIGTRLLVFVIGILLFSACGTHGQNNSKLTSQSWREFISVAKQYDSLQTVFKKMQNEDPELKKNPSLMQAKLKDDIQHIYAIYQALPQKAAAAVKEVGNIDEYGIDDLRYVKLAAVSTNEITIALKTNERLIGIIKAPDSLREMKMEMAQFHAILGNLDQAASFATDDVLSETPEMSKVQLFSLLSEGYLNEENLERAKHFTLKSVRALRVYQNQLRADEQTDGTARQKGAGNASQEQYFIRQYAEILSPLLYELKQTGGVKSYEAFLAEAKNAINDEEIWSAANREIKVKLETIEEENKALEKSAPKWEEHEWIGTESLSLEKLRGKVVLMDFFATWCRPCIVAFPHVREWQEKYSSKGLVIVGMTNYQGRYEGAGVKAVEELAKLKDDFIPKHKVTWPVGVEKEGRKTFEAYNVSGIPHVVIIDKKGNVRYFKTGAGDYGKTERIIKKLLSEK